jgi:hypothetical protein
VRLARFAVYLREGQAGEVLKLVDVEGLLVREAALKVLLKRVLQSSEGDERVLGALIAGDAAYFFLDMW